MRSPVTFGLLLMVLCSACAPGSGGEDAMPPSETRAFVREAEDLTARAFAAAAEQVGEQLDRTAPATFVSCSEQGEGAIELQSRGSLRYARDQESGALGKIERAWSDLGLDVAADDDTLTATTTVEGVEVQVSLDRAVEMRDGSGQVLRYLGAITPACLDVGAEAARELTR